ncbi:MAG: site-specific DNA-methyltransferase [Candidimonas sp.]
MKNIPDNSIDMILCDLPYGTTDCKWDSVIPFQPMWEQYNRIVRRGSAIVLHSSQPFTTTLISSNMEHFSYCWVWDKKFAANFAIAKLQPLKTHEDICVFSVDKKLPRYYPQMIQREKPIKLGKNAGMTEAIPLTPNKSYEGKVYNEKYPDSQLHFSSREQRGLHPTQKPVSLAEYLIKTYTIEGDVVLDNCMGSGTTGVACHNLGRKFIGIEKDEKIFDIASQRIHGHTKIFDVVDSDFVSSIFEWETDK